MTRRYKLWGNLDEIELTEREHFKKLWKGKDIEEGKRGAKENRKTEVK